MPPDHFGWGPERMFDLGFVRDLIQDAYADTPGRLTGGRR
jgi:hypothetical protein